MNRLQMATLLSWTGDHGMQGRKKLQKVIYLLQAAGCPLDCSFRLHHYGPYSQDVANLCDEMVAADLIEEAGGPSESSPGYSYQLAERTRGLLTKTTAGEMTPFHGLALELLDERIWPLELGSTILLFKRQGHDWQAALAAACEFKNVPPDLSPSLDALELAKKVDAATRN